MPKVIEWFSVNKLSVNLDKTNYMMFMTKNNSPGKPTLSIKVNDVVLEKVNNCKFLGVWIDDRLNWKYHITQISNKLSKIIGIFKKIRWKLGKQILSQLYYSLAFPYFIYCNVTWAANYDTCLDKIVKIQKKLVRIINNSSFNAHTDPIFRYFNFLKFNQINIYMTGIFMYKIINNLMPPIFQNMFHHVFNLHRYPTRQSQNLYTPRYRTTRSKFAIKFHGSIVWNTIPPNIQMVQSLFMFKRKLKHYLIESL